MSPDREGMQRRFLPTEAAVSDAVREGRAAKGWTIAELAETSGIEAAFIEAVEAGSIPREQGNIGSMLDTLEALGIYATALPSIPNGMRLEDVDLDEWLKHFE